MLLHMHRGTPTFTKGEELGMTNAHFTRSSSIAIWNPSTPTASAWRKPKCQSAESMMAALALIGRDNARTPDAVGRFQVCWFHRAGRGDGTVDRASIRIMSRSTQPRNSTIRIRVQLLQEAHRHAPQQQRPSRRANGNLVAADSEQVYSFTRTSGDDTICPVNSPTGRRVPADVAELLEDGVSDRKYRSAPMMPCIVLNRRSRRACSLGGRDQL